MADEQHTPFTTEKVGDGPLGASWCVIGPDGKSVGQHGGGGRGSAERSANADAAQRNNMYRLGYAAAKAEDAGLLVACEAIIHAEKMNDPAMGAVAATLARSAIASATKGGAK